MSHQTPGMLELKRALERAGIAYELTHSSSGLETLEVGEISLLPLGDNPDCRYEDGDPGAEVELYWLEDGQHEQVPFSKLTEYLGDD